MAISKINGRELGEIKHSSKQEELALDKSLDLALMQEHRIPVDLIDEEKGSVYREDTHFYKIVSYKFSRNHASVIELEFNDDEGNSKSLFIEIEEHGGCVNLSTETFKQEPEDSSKPDCKVCVEKEDLGHFNI
tara:strand:- start:44 stop:442 length:399 start_codon:yes stop_codon:yes gene_type:complete